jgi:hypothetical protein
MSLARNAASLVAIATLCACGSQGGGDLRAHDGGTFALTQFLGPAINPSSPTKLKNGAAIENVVVIVGAIDTYDESRTGYRKGSTGNVFVQDPLGPSPYGGAILYRATSTPTTYIPQPGDAVVLTNGTFQPYGGPSTVSFPVPLPEISTASYALVAQGAYPTPDVITLDTLSTAAKGQPYLGRVVRLENIAIASAFPGPDMTNPTGSSVNREAPLTSATSGPVPAISCELAPVDDWKRPDGTPLLQPGKPVKSITGVLDFFGSSAFGGFLVAPRSVDDIEL